MSYGSYGFSSGPVSTPAAAQAALPSGAGNGSNTTSPLMPNGSAGNGAVPQIGAVSTSASSAGSTQGQNNGATSSGTTTGAIPANDTTTFGGPNFGGGYGVGPGANFGANFGGGYGAGSPETFGSNPGQGFPASGGQYMAFADGGPVNGVTDIGQALATVQGVLAQGRQQHGLPAKIYKGKGSYNDMRPSQNVEDDRNWQMSTPAGANDSSPAMWPNPDGSIDMDSSQSNTQGYAAGGDVTPGADMNDPSGAGGAIPDQPNGTPSLAGGPPQIASYLSGAGSIGPDVAQALEGRSGTADPDARKIMAIANAPPEAQFPLMQHYRQQFEGHKAFAQAAALGSGQKPGDMRASTLAATQAYQNVPDGNAVAFAPTQGGVHVTVRSLAGGKTKRYDDGGPVTDDSIGEPDADAISNVTAAVTKGNQDLQNATGAIPDEAESAAQGAMNAIGSGNEAIQNFTMSIPQYLLFLRGTSGQYDQVMDNGMAEQINNAINSQGAAYYTPDTQPPQAGTTPNNGPAVNAAINSQAAGQTATGSPSPGVTPSSATAVSPSTPTVGNTPGSRQQSLKDFIAQYNKRNNTNYSVGNAAPNFQVGNGQPAIAAGVPVPGSTQPLAPVGSQPVAPRQTSVIPADIRAAAAELFPLASQMNDRNAYMAKEMSNREEMANKVEVAQNQRLYGTQATAGARTDAAQIAANSRVNVEQLKANAVIAAKGNPNTAGAWKAVSAAITANPGQYQTQQQVTQLLRSYGLDPRTVNIPTVAAPQTPQAGQGATPGVKWFRGKPYVSGPDGMPMLAPGYNAAAPQT